MTIVKLALRELWGSRRQLLLPAITLSLAIASLYILLSFDFKINELIFSDGRDSMGADLSVEAIRPISEQEREKIKILLPESSQQASIIDFNTMMEMPEKKESRFVRLQAVSQRFPFYGTWKISGANDFSNLHESPIAFVPKDVVDQYHLKIGSLLKFGNSLFKLGGIIEKRPGQFTAALGFAPNVWISDRFLKDTGLLIRPGRIDYSQIYRIPGRADPESLSQKIKDEFKDPILRIRSYKESQRGFQRIFDRLKLFAQFISIAALLIGALSIFGSLQTWLKQRQYLIAVLRAFGASSIQIDAIVLSSSFFLSASASLLGIILGHFGQLQLTPYLESFVQLPPHLKLPFSIPLVCFVTGVVASLLFSLWSLLEVSRFKPIILIRNELQAVQRKRAKLLIATLLVLFFFLFCIYLTASLWNAFIITISTIGSLLVAALTCYFLFSAMSKLKTLGSISFAYASRSILREKVTALISSALFFLVTMILTGMILFEKGLQKELQVDDQTRRSSVFIFDLGEEKKAEVQNFLKPYPDVQAIWASWVNARWLKINDKNLEEHLDEVRSFDRERGVQIALNLPKNASVVDGKMWDGPYTSGIEQVSVSDFYAEDRNIKVGDILQMSIYGVDFEAVVSNIRKVRWIDFEPAFVFMFQDGFFENLPTNYLASFSMKTREERLQFLSAFSKKFPEISLIDVSEVKQDLLKITAQVSQVARSILLFLLILGVSLVAALSREKLLTRRLEFTNFKVFGASKAQLSLMLAYEFLLLASIPSFFGSLLGFAIGNWGLKYFFSAYGVVWSNWIVILPIGLSLLVVGIGLLGSLQLFKMKWGEVKVFADAAR